MLVLNFPAGLYFGWGERGRLQDIVQSAASWLGPGGRIVLSAVTPDTFSAAWGSCRGQLGAA